MAQLTLFDFVIPLKPVPPEPTWPDGSFCAVYAIIHRKSGKLYIGSSVDLRKRLNGHRTALVRNVHGNRYLQNGWNKHGADAFCFRVIELSNATAILAIEQKWMDFFESYRPDRGFNIEPNASNSLGSPRQFKGRATCPQCYGRMKAGAAVCRRCRRICITCGCQKRKSSGLRCRSCAMKLLPRSESHLESLRSVGRSRRIEFADLTTRNFRRHVNGRFHGTYWDDGHRRSIYRYQWVWMVAHGPIPAGHDVRHKNGDVADDRPENLELRSAVARVKFLADSARKPRIACVNCGCAGRKRKNGLPSPFCSVACFREYIARHGRAAIWAMRRERLNSLQPDQLAKIPSNTSTIPYTS